MFARALDTAETRLDEVLAKLEPEVLDSRDAQALVERFASLERKAAAGKALVARRVAASGAWRSSGERTAANWMARATGTSVGQAWVCLRLPRRSRSCPPWIESFRAGKLSEVQAKEVASAASASPKAEKQLLKAAATEDLASHFGIAVPGFAPPRCRMRRPVTTGSGRAGGFGTGVTVRGRSGMRGRARRMRGP